MFAQMSASEWRDWQTWHKLRGPLGGRRLDYLAAALCYWIVEVQRAKGDPMPFETFLLDWDPAIARAKARAANADPTPAASKAAWLGIFADAGIAPPMETG